MCNINHALKEFKTQIEKSILERGSAGKTALIRSSTLINLIHDAVKRDLITEGIISDQIYPNLGKSSPEIKLAGLLKQKDQDICVLPKNTEKVATEITWGPMAFEGKTDEYGEDFTTKTLAINVRSQISSITKNTDTLFERTFAEALNLHLQYPRMVLGEVYMIPVHEYDEKEAQQKRVKFRTNHTDIEKYISFFSALNGRTATGDPYRYERVALLIVDFDKDTPKLYNDTDSLREDGLISESFGRKYEPLSFDSFAKDITEIYEKRFGYGLIREAQNAHKSS